MTKFLEKKPELLTINPLPSVNIIPNRKLLQFSQPLITSYPPKQKTLSISHGVVSMSIKPLEVTKMPSKKPLSVSNICTTDIPPDPYPCMYSRLVAPDLTIQAHQHHQFQCVVSARDQLMTDLNRNTAVKRLCTDTAGVNITA